MNENDDLCNNVICLEAYCYLFGGLWMLIYIVSLVLKLECYLCGVALFVIISTICNNLSCVMSCWNVVAVHVCWIVLLSMVVGTWKYCW